MSADDPVAVERGQLIDEALYPQIAAERQLKGTA
jgi:hypothetical protein